MLRERGFPIADADQFAQDVLCPGEPAYRAIIERFGDDLVDRHGHIDRALGRVVFDDDDARCAQRDCASSDHNVQYNIRC